MQSSPISTTARGWERRRRKTTAATAPTSWTLPPATSTAHSISAYLIRISLRNSSRGCRCRRNKGRGSRAAPKPTGKTKCHKWCQDFHHRWTQLAASGICIHRWQNRAERVIIIIERSITKNACSASKCRSKLWIWKRSWGCIASRMMNWGMRLRECKSIIKTSTQPNPTTTRS